MRFFPRTFEVGMLGVLFLVLSVYFLELKCKWSKNSIDKIFIEPVQQSLSLGVFLEQLSIVYLTIHIFAFRKYISPQSTRYISQFSRNVLKFVIKNIALKCLKKSILSRSSNLRKFHFVCFLLIHLFDLHTKLKVL